MYHSLFIIFCNLLVHSVKFSKSFTAEVVKNIIGMLSHFNFVRWLIIHGAREGKISGRGGGFVRFSYLVYVTYCRFALFWTFMPYFRWL